MKNKFSIIVPVYNVEKYLKRCLESIVKQTYNNYEVIVVCDKSSDNSEIIADKFINKYKWTKIYEENTGLSKARNLGLAKARGEYILFLDGDDYFENNLLETLNNNLSESPDILRFQTREIFEDNVINYAEVGFDICDGVNAFKYINRYHFIENSWLYCYKKDFWDKYNFKFMEGCIAEDYGLTPLIIAKADKVKSISYIGYNYVQRDNSLMNNDNNLKKIKKMDDMLKQANFMKNKLVSVESKEIISFINNSLIYYSTTLKYKDFRKYKRILNENKCFNHLKSNKLKTKIKNYLIKLNAYVFYNYILRWL